MGLAKGRHAAVFLDRAGAAFDRRRWHADARALGPLGLTGLEAELRRT